MRVYTKDVGENIKDKFIGENLKESLEDYNNDYIKKELRLE